MDKVRKGVGRSNLTMQKIMANLKHIKLAPQLRTEMREQKPKCSPNCTATQNDTRLAFKVYNLTNADICS